MPEEIKDTENITENEITEDTSATEISDNTASDKNNSDSPAKKHRYWIISLVLIIIGGGLNLYLVNFLKDFSYCIQIGPLSTDMLVKGSGIVWTIGLLSLPAFIYDDFKKKKTVGWIVVGFIMVCFIALSMFLTIKSDRAALGPYNLGYKGYTHGDYKYVISTENDYLGNTYYIYWYQTGPFTYTQFYTTYLSDTEVWKEDRLFLKNFDDTYIEILYDAFYGYKADK